MHYPNQESPGFQKHAHESDDQLIHRCQLGDGKAWSTLVHRYDSLIYAVARRFPLPEDDVADIFQSVCLALLTQIRNSTPPEKLSSWLVSVTRHEALYVIKKKKRSFLFSEVSAASVESSIPMMVSEEILGDLDEDLLRIESRFLVQRGLDLLKERCRKLLSYLYTPEATPSYTEVALYMHMPINSVGPIRARCLKSLKKILISIGF